MKATCPNGCKLNRFYTVVHVTADWLVDEHGNFIDTLDTVSEVMVGPDSGNTWTCVACAAEAEVRLT